jgi:hypothetical protein
MQAGYAEKLEPANTIHIRKNKLERNRQVGTSTSYFGTRQTYGFANIGFTVLNWLGVLDIGQSRPRGAIPGPEPGQTRHALTRAGPQETCPDQTQARRGTT